MLVVVTAVGSASPARAVSSALGAAADAAPRLLLPFALVVALWMMCPDTDDRVGADRQALGLDAVRWTAARVVLICAVLLVGLGLFVVTRSLAALLLPGSPPSADVAIPRLLTIAVLSSTLFGLWAGSLLRGRRTATALMVSLTTVMITVAVAFAPRGGLGDLVRSLWPVSALRVIAGGGEGVAPQVGATAVASICLVTLWAVFRLSMSESSPSRGTTSPGGDGRRLTFRSVAAVGVAACVAAGSVLPTFLTRTLPWSSRPSTVLQQLSGTDPAARTRTFLEAVWTHNTAAADSLTAQASAARTIGPFRQVVGARPPTLDVHVVDIGSEGTAAVVADGFAQSVTFCMSRRRGAWIVESLSTRQVCS
ncbi:hypothetical protein H9L10_15525 [Phycicoccus endophyticus]|uniref:ABC transporter permease n=1 Tax=Phycicoccus endophyticus TaxID=1690220 RepID=A0A7G9R1S8_9MICO|nr:hypothetical protein [Phycicoccus endophyticus]NHI18649.1 hypothetical protein [Phycicoccus endophyticus]QNN49553.1 hypothetical protein H9L10_15525 [Phycicoccus endophyticus]